MKLSAAARDALTLMATGERLSHMPYGWKIYHGGEPRQVLLVPSATACWMSQLALVKPVRAGGTITQYEISDLGREALGDRT